MKLPYQYTETADFEKGFAAYYEQHIVPLKDILDPERERIHAKNSVNQLFAALLSLISTVLLLFSAKFWGIFAGYKSGRVIPAVWIAFWWLLVKRHKDKYFTSAKAQTMPLLVRFIGDFTYEAKGRIDKEILKNHHLFPKRCSYNFEDHITGIYKGTPIEIAEVQVNEPDGDNVFKGILILFNKNTPIEGIIRINPSRSLFNLWKNTEEDNLILTKTDNEQFDFDFKVYTNKKEVAANLLTATLQRKLLQLNMIFCGNGLRCSYMGEKVLLAIPSTENMFEPGPIDVPSVNAANIKRLLHEMKTILEVIDAIGT